MSRGARELGLAALLAIALGAALLPLAGIALTVPTGDEFVIGYDARRLSAGERPYVDFHSVEPPAGAALHATLYRLVGPSQLASRVLALVIAALTAALAFLLLRRAAVGRGLAALGALASVGSFLLWPYPTPHGPALLAALVAFYVASGDGRVALRCALGGACVVLSDLFHPAVGVAAMVGLALLLGRQLRARWRWALLGGAAVIALTALLLAAAGVLGAALGALLWPLGHYRQAAGFNDVPFGAGIGDAFAATRAESGTLAAWGYLALGGAVLALALVGPALLLPATLLARRRSRAQGHEPIDGVALALLAGGAALAVTQIYQRPDVTHLGFAAALLLPASVSLAAPLPRWVRGLGRALCGLALGGAVVWTTARALTIGWPWPALDGVLAGWPAVREMRALTRDGDCIAVLPAGGLYYAYARPAAIGYSWLMPPRARYHDERDYAKVATQLARARLIFFLTPLDLEDFRDNAGPLSTVLRRDFREVQTPLGPALAPSGK